MNYTVIDLFSGAGGMSYGFKAHGDFVIIGAVDAQLGKPSNGSGNLDCNDTYESNIGTRPINKNLHLYDPEGLQQDIGVKRGDIDVLISCAPCTGFSRANPLNHIVDDQRNSLVIKSFRFVSHFSPNIFLMENARELLTGKFSYHFKKLKTLLEEAGYDVYSKVHFLNKFGLPQTRERALIVAAKKGFKLRSLEDVWSGFKIDAKSTTVRSAIGEYPSLAAGEPCPNDPMHISPKVNGCTLERLKAVPHDGGSWKDLVNHKYRDRILTPAMKRYVEQGRFGSHPDVYGRLWWEKPSVTIKRECGHVGNGRYSHPEQDRLCTVRELATLQGFPSNYIFKSNSLTNMYRHIGDAVPPLISYQLAWVCHWILSGNKPCVDNLILNGTHLSQDDILKSTEQLKLAI
ncbi:DNA cytosine methyltransferase [Fundidesulfovibrio butyratiphilus]